MLTAASALARYSSLFFRTAAGFGCGVHFRQRCGGDVCTFPSACAEAAVVAKAPFFLALSPLLHLLPSFLGLCQSYTVTVSHLEIYNEELTDLLEEELDLLEVRFQRSDLLLCPWLLRPGRPCC